MRYLKNKNLKILFLLIVSTASYYKYDKTLTLTVNHIDVK